MNELIQEISTYIIISGTAIYSVYKMTRFFASSQKKGGCAGCSGGSCGLNTAKHLQKRQLSAIKTGLVYRK